MITKNILKTTLVAGSAIVLAATLGSCSAVKNAVDTAQTAAAGVASAAADAANAYHQLSAGECFMWSGMDMNTSGVPPVPCTDAHDAEAVGTYTSTQAAPVGSGFDAEASAKCSDLTASFIGEGWDTRAWTRPTSPQTSPRGAGATRPSRASW